LSGLLADFKFPGEVEVPHCLTMRIILSTNVDSTFQLDSDERSVDAKVMANLRQVGNPRDEGFKLDVIFLLQLAFIVVTERRLCIWVDL
jgi:hypothetical protein